MRKAKNFTFLLIFLYISAISLIHGITFKFLLSKRSNFFGTDEIMIGYYSDHLLLHGLNPYNPNNTADVFTYYNISIATRGTPLTTGGVVTNLNYPALYFLIYLPSYLMKISPNFIVFIFYILVPVIIYIKRRDIFDVFVAGYIISYYYLSYSLGGVDDIIWVFFLLLSFLSENVLWKGIFYGLAISYKQTPLIFLPFYLIQLKKDSLKFLLIASTIFFIINGYFLILSPRYYLSDILTPIISNLIQIGNGIDIFSIIGIFYEYPLFYVLSQLTIYLIGIYISWKRDMKLESVGFIYYTMFFMYRMLYNYIAFLPIFSYLGNDKLKGINKKELKLLVSLGIVLIVTFALVFHYGFSEYYSSLHIQVIQVHTNNRGMVYSILLNVSYEGKNPYEIKPLFRIFSAGGPHLGNGLLWNSNATWISSGKSELVLIYTNCSDLEFKNGTPTIINAYYGYMNAYTTLYY